MAEEKAPDAEKDKPSDEEIMARLTGEEKKPDVKVEVEAPKPEPEQEKEQEKEPEKPDPDLEQIVAQADNPDAVRNAIKRQQARADEQRDRADELAAKVKEYEDRDKSEQEKLEERAAQAERDAADAKSKLLRIEVATAAKLPLELADRLQGATKKELETDASRLLELVKPSVPSGDVDAGKGAAAATEDDFSALLRQRAGLSR